MTLDQLRKDAVKEALDAIEKSMPDIQPLTGTEKDAEEQAFKIGWNNYQDVMVSITPARSRNATARSGGTMGRGRRKGHTLTTRRARRITKRIMMENFCEACRIQYKSYAGYRAHVSRGKNHKEIPYSTDRELTAWEKKALPLKNSAAR
jgi:hypothetical protein